MLCRVVLVVHRATCSSYYESLLVSYVAKQNAMRSVTRSVSVSERWVTRFLLVGRCEDLQSGNGTTYFSTAAAVDREQV